MRRRSIPVIPEKGKIMKLKFGKDGKFRILHMTDAQESVRVSPNTVKLIEASVKKVKPDLVIFTGDQIKNYGLGFSSKNAPKYAQGLIDSLFAPIDRLGVPFAITFGNHDVCKYVSKQQQIEMYAKYENFVRAQDYIHYDSGTYALPIYSSDGSEIVYAVYMIDSQGNNSTGGYEAPLPEQVEWYRQTRDELEKLSSKPVPAMVFQHIPVCEMYNIFKRVDKGTKGSIRAYRSHNKEYFLLDESKCREMGNFKEPASIPDENTGEFAAMKEKGDVRAMFFGHDHKNCFVGTCDGIDLGFTPSCGFNTYGDGKNRGSRQIVIDEKDLSYTTKPYTYSELCGSRVKRPVKDAILSWIPTSPSDILPKVSKLLGVLLGIGALIAAVVILITKYL